MAKHEFGIIDKLSNSPNAYESYEPDKYHCISMHDDFIGPLLPELEDLDTFYHNMERPEKGLAYCGITLISPSSLMKFRKILISKNNHVYDELIKVIDMAIEENKFIIHYGI
ncbi:hypothetical protein [Clostridium sp. Marseille-P299]|uniref:hypothetical protein n=1 Tax=Clostridium sp. Marseille-P299 TaxID=1805477 RepID=UPI000832CF19|nr:hypothetical protein [Clostridium sp. Marseille-P299]